MTSTLLSPVVDYYNDEEELDSVDEDDDRSYRGRDSEEDTEDASETDLAKQDEDDYVEIKEQMYQDKLASLKRQLAQLQEGTLQEYQKRMKKLDQQYKERLRNADLFLQLETEQVERNYIKEKKAAVKEFEDKKIELKENLIAELEEKKKMIENEKLTMELTGGTMSDRKAVIKNADMSEEMQQDAVECATQALEKFNIEKDIAAYIKKEFDKKYNPTWHCIVGRNFGSYVTHETKHFIYFYLGQVAILLFKSG
ncbi:UNVERIFIED_CONTAM: hypothetical protein FKN15_011572 [Acipenser sinensis]